MIDSLVHLYKPAADPRQIVLLMLHGTGGDEHDLMPLAEELNPEAAVLSPRGNVRENGMPRFFRRLAEGVFDVEDLKTRSAELAEFVREGAAHYRFDPARVVAVGFSNGANIAGSLLLLHPGVLAGAVLFRAMVPIVPDPLPRHEGTPVLLSNGRSDPLVSGEETERLASLLRASGADLSLVWQTAGHHLVREDLVSARAWLAQHF